jgi:hypothetical protein
MADTTKTPPAEVEPDPAAEFVHLAHDDLTDGAVIPNDATVLEAYRARGWRVVQAPDPDAPVQPATSEATARAAEQAREVAAAARAAAPATDGTGYGDEEGWVELVHPLDGHAEPARARIPADDAAVAGYLEKGWVVPNRDGSVPARAVKAAAKESAGDRPAAKSTGPADTAADTKEQ